MKTAILVHGPDFACSENLTRAFALWGDTHLISLKDTDWRNYDPGLVISDDTLDEAWRLADEADLLVLGDATSFHCLAKIGSVNWLSWARQKRIIAFFGDTQYYQHPEYYDGLLLEIGVSRLFLLPNLINLTGLDAVPLHHPMPVIDYEKTEGVRSIIHSPGRDGKLLAKGTREVEGIINMLRDEGYEFDYQRLMHLPLCECLAIKGQAHIVIDQLPPPNYPRGLGRSGLEALATGSAVVSAMYPEKNLRDFFPMPPVVAVNDVNELYLALQKLLSDTGYLTDLQARGQEWVAENVAFDPWLAYVGRYL